MIIYKNVFERLSAHGWSQYKLQKENVIGGGTILRIMKGKSISTDTIDKICSLCKCQPNDIIECVPDKTE